MRTILIRPAMTLAAIALGTPGAALASIHDNEIPIILGAKTSVVQAIKTAEQKTGGRAFEIGLGKEKDAYLYEIRTVSEDKVKEVSIDPVSGDVVKADDEGLIAKILDWEEQGALDTLAASLTSLSDAIVVAEENVGGKAVEADFSEDFDDDEESVPTFEIKVLKDNTVHKVFIDSTTGTVLAIVTSGNDENDD